MERIILEKKRCLRCGYEWFPRPTNLNPRQCPSCKSALWDIPKKPRKEGRDG